MVLICQVLYNSSSSSPAPTENSIHLIDSSETRTVLRNTTAGIAKYKYKAQGK